MMRESAFREFAPLWAIDTREQMADHLTERFGSRGCIRVDADDGAVVAIGDVVETRPNVVSLLFFATDRFPEVARPATRFIVRRLLPELRALGVHRIEAIAAADNKEAHRWIQTMGLSQEAVLRKFGRNGEDYINFAWVKPDVCAPSRGVG